MAIGVGGQTAESALACLRNMTSDMEPIQTAEFEMRLGKLRSAMKANSVDAIFLHAGNNLRYFTGLQWNPSERMVAAIVFSDGDMVYICPHFEVDTVKDYWVLEADIKLWHEHENPSETLAAVLTKKRIANGKLLVDANTPFFMVDGIRKSNPDLEIINALPITQSIRAKKSEAELNLIRRAHEMTLEVHKAAAAILRPGITTTEVAKFIDDAHIAVGASGSFFCIVLFGVATSFPHGVKDPQTLQPNDWVLIDTGCLLQGYNSDITRSFPIGEPTAEQRDAWEVEKAAQIAAFDGAILGQPCEVADAAARRSLEAAGYGPDYQLPGLPHRTGHGCGLDIHEGPFLVRGEQTPLSEGMVFSSEPMLVIPDKFGVRLEDHFYMTSTGPQWFTQPSHSIDDPFGMNVS